MTKTLAIRVENAPNIKLSKMTKDEKELLGLAFSCFMDAAATDTGRATAYNTKEEQEAAAKRIHTDLLSIDRGIYGLSLLLPGVTDRTRQEGLANLLDSEAKDSVLAPNQEGRLVCHLTSELPPQRMLKMFEKFRERRINNSRTRKLILRTILRAQKVGFWAVKYKKKVGSALRHAWGGKIAGAIKSIVAKPGPSRSDKEVRILNDNLFRFCEIGDGCAFKTRQEVEEVVGFVLGASWDFTMPLLKAYANAKSDLSAAKRLPVEVLEGFRGRFHKDTTRENLLKLAKNDLTTHQKLSMQRQMKEADVKVEVDPREYDAVRLYVYAMEMGMTAEFRQVLDQKAKKSAAGMPIKYSKVGIVVDASSSMMGDKTQKNKPMAVVLATRDMLENTGKKSVVRYAGGKDGQHGLVYPCGDTSLAESLVEVLKDVPEVVFILSDGYENAPAGRVAEVVGLVRKLGIKTPIHQISPVMAAESHGVRSLGEGISALPIHKPEAMSLTLLKSMFELDVEKGVSALMGLTLPVLESSVGKEE